MVNYAVKTEWKHAVVKKYNPLTFKIIGNTIYAYSITRLVGKFDKVSNTGFIF